MLRVFGLDQERRFPREGAEQLEGPFIGAEILSAEQGIREEDADESGVLKVRGPGRTEVAGDNPCLLSGESLPEPSPWNPG